jgi:hypothetical protein
MDSDDRLLLTAVDAAPPYRLDNGDELDDESVVDLTGFDQPQCDDLTGFDQPQCDLAGPLLYAGWKTVPNVDPTPQPPTDVSTSSSKTKTARFIVAAMVALAIVAASFAVLYFTSPSSGHHNTTSESIGVDADSINFNDLQTLNRRLSEEKRELQGLLQRDIADLQHAVQAIRDWMMQRELSTVSNSSESDTGDTSDTSDTSTSRGDTDAIYRHLGTLGARLQAFEQDITTMKGTVDTLTNATTTHTALINTLNGSVSHHSITLNTLNMSITKQSTDITIIEEGIEDLTTKSNSQEDLIDVIESSLSAQSNRISAQESATDRLGADVNTLESTALDTADIKNYIHNKCHLYFGMRNQCNGCMDPPRRYGLVNQRTCYQHGSEGSCNTFNLFGRDVRMLGLTPDRGVGRNDQFYIGLICD